MSCLRPSWRGKIISETTSLSTMQAATAAGATMKATLADLVECHITTLVRESALVNRHSKRGGSVSAADYDDDDCADDDGEDDAANVEGGGGGGNNHKKRRAKRRMIHHDDVNMALLWRGSEKLYVSGVPLFSNDHNEEGADDDDDRPNSGGGGMKPNNTTIHNNNNGGLDRLLRSTAKTDDVVTVLPSLLSSSIVPRVDLNAYLASELTVRPPCELKCTLHWLAVEGVQPMIPENQIWSEAYYNNNNNRRAAGGGGLRHALAPLAATTTPSSLLPGLLDYNNNDDDNIIDNDDTTDTYDKSSIRIRELQQRILSEELRLYYERVTSTIDTSNNNNNNNISSSSSTT